MYRMGRSYIPNARKWHPESCTPKVALGSHRWFQSGFGYPESCLSVASGTRKWLQSGFGHLKVFPKALGNSVLTLATQSIFGMALEWLQNAKTRRCNLWWYLKRAGAYGCFATLKQPHFFCILKPLCSHLWVPATLKRL